MSTWQAPEDVLWTLRKDERTAEARTGIVSLGGGRLELRIYANSNEKGTFDLLWSQVMKDSRAVRASAEEKRQEFMAQGWTSAAGT